MVRLQRDDAAIGPVAGGWLIEHVSWRAAFFLNVPLAVVVLALSLRFMDESRDASRTGRVDWTGAVLAVIGLGGIVFGLLEAPPLGIGEPARRAVRWRSGQSALVLFVVVERRTRNPMLPLALFRSRTFTLANVLTLVLYAALDLVMFLVPLNLIQVQRYTPTQAGAALLPFPMIMFALSRWSGGLVARIGSRLPLTIGPAIAAVGIVAVRTRRIRRLLLDDVLSGGGRPGMRRWPTTVAPLTTTVMGAVETLTRRRRVRREQRRRARRGTAGDRGLRSRAHPDVRRAGSAGARPSRDQPRQSERRSSGSCRRWLART